MTSVKIDNQVIEIEICRADSFQELLNIPKQKAFWVNLTVENEDGDKVSFPLVDSDYRVRLFDEYSEAIDSTAQLLLDHSGLVRMADSNH